MPSATLVDLKNIVTEPSQEARLAFEEFFRGPPPQPGRQRLLAKVLSGTTMKSFTAFARDWLPPILFRLLRTLVRRGGGGEAIRFEGDFATWEEASAQCTGYDAEPILGKVLEATLKVERGEAAYERDSVLFSEIEYVWPLLAGLMWAAARSGGRLNVLDFGGALGSSYFQNRKFLDTLPEVRWNIVEQAHYVDAGRANIQDERLRFYSTIEECLRATQPNVVVLSSVLQYLKSPIEVINKLSVAGAALLIIDRTSFSADTKDKILIQQVLPGIYTASYPMWVFSEQAFINILDADWCLVASNLSPEGFVHSAEGFNFSFQGMLLEARR